MEVMDVDWRYGRMWIGWIFILIASIIIKENYLYYTDFLSLSDKESVILSTFIPVYTLRKKTEIKTVSVLTRLPCSLVPWWRLNWLNGCCRENTFNVDCKDRCTQNKEFKKCRGVEEGSVTGDCKNDFMNN